MYSRETKINGGKKKKRNMQIGKEWNPCVLCTRASLSTKAMSIFHSVISSFWRENILVGLRIKYLNSTNFFLHFLQPNTHQKYSLLYFPSFLKSSQPNKFEEQLYLYKWLDISLITHDDDKNFGKFTKKHNNKAQLAS